MKLPLFALGGLALSAAIVGCSGNSDSGKKEEPKAAETPAVKPLEPVTIQFATQGNIFSEDEFKRYVQAPVAKKYPHITLQYINTSVKGSEIQNLVAAKLIPDIVTNYGSTLSQGTTSLKEMGLLYNIDPLIKENKFDTARLIPETLEFIKRFAVTDYLPGLPAYNNEFGLFYNKTLFDRFAQPYPTDGMTWEQVGELARKVTRFEGGVQYRGIYSDGIYRVMRQAGLRVLDDNGVPQLTSDPWKNLLTLFFNVYDYQGNTSAPFDKDFNYGNNQTAFINGQLAMLAGYSNTLFELRKSPNLDWNVVTYPQFKGNVNYGSSVDVPIMSITSQSTHKTDAMRVIETVLSDDVQLDLARNGRMSVLTSKAVTDEFGKALPEFAGKNISLSSMVKNKLSLPPIEGKYYTSDVGAVFNSTLASILKKEKDMNTALREGEEQMSKIVQQNKSK
jgi:multiple sugar transport system substrate-binding protein